MDIVIHLQSKPLPFQLQMRGMLIHSNLALRLDILPTSLPRFIHEDEPHWTPSLQPSKLTPRNKIHVRYWPFLYNSPIFDYWVLQYNCDPRTNVEPFLWPVCFFNILIKKKKHFIQQWSIDYWEWCQGRISKQTCYKYLSYDATFTEIY